jgi:two-component system, chemotaxis family, protein-glutamate methylesterase/glutaminase
MKNPKLMTKRTIIVIGTSTGGLDALCELNKHLPKDLASSIFVVMHIGATSLLPQILSRCGNLPAVSAEHERHYKRGVIYCAPANCHMVIKDHATLLTRGPRENGHRPAADVLFRSAARVHRSKVVGVVLSGGRDDGSAGLYAIKVRGGVAIVQDPGEATSPEMPQNALEMVDVDFCLPVRQIADVLVDLANGNVKNMKKRSRKGDKMEEQATAERPTSEPPGDQIPIACPECNGPMWEVKNGGLALFQCFVGHRFSPESLSEEHGEALERALWTAIRKLKERVVLHQRLLKQKRNNGEQYLFNRLEESVTTAERDIKLLREILERI